MNVLDIENVTPIRIYENPNPDLSSAADEIQSPLAITQEKIQHKKIADAYFKLAHYDLIFLQ